MLDDSTRLVNANHKVNSKADELSRALNRLGSPREGAGDFDLVIKIIGELLVAKAERDQWQEFG
jgi:hypothetical protein